MQASTPKQQVEGGTDNLVETFDASKASRLMLPWQTPTIAFKASKWEDKEAEAHEE